jgi:hypothetical protein
VRPGLARAGRLLSAATAGLVLGASVGFWLPILFLFIQFFTGMQVGRGEPDGFVLMHQMILSSAATSLVGAVLGIVHCLVVFR